MTYVLVVDDDEAFAGMLAESLSAAGFEVATAGGEARALALAEAEPGLVFLDLRMDGNERAGLDVLSGLRRMHPTVPVVMMTAFGDVQAAVAAMKAGALDFIEKPVDIAQVRRMAAELMIPEGDGDDAAGEAIPFGGIVPAPGPMREAVGLLLAAAGTDVPVLVTGESGTGKEIAAAFLHERGPRAGGPLIKVNCSAIPEGLVESEMFGSEAGAFTGAARSRPGRFAAAEGGTIFLDEIAEMDGALQAKLLRVLQEKEYEPVGAARPRKADVRVIAATNRPIQESIRAGRLREDLYFRLNVFQVGLPPLRERRADIVPLARCLLSRVAGERPRRLSAEAEAMLVRHPWPGNVRELANAMDRARILARGGVVHPEHLPPTIRAASPVAPPSFVPPSGTSVHEMERQLIERTLERTGQNRSEAARQLGISRRALLYKIKRYGLSG
jgi:DNA-binding NtrC family response regulator